MLSNVHVALILFWLNQVLYLGSSAPCKAIQAQHGIVCVCDDTYCDSIDPLGELGMMDIAVYTSSQAGHRLERQNIQFQTHHKGQWQHIMISYDKKYQTMRGFGGAITDSAVKVFNRMQPSIQELLMEQYFGASGAQYTTARVPMGSTDFSDSIYSYADEPADDLELKNFSIERDLVEKIPFIQRMQTFTKRNVSLFSAPWNPPLWMLDGDTYIHNPRLKDYDKETAQAWALYFIKFLDAYKERGINFWAISVQNEPGGNTGQWQTIKYTPEQQREFLKKHLGPALRLHHPEVEVMVFDDQRVWLPDWIDPIMEDQDARQYVHGVGVHWYAATEDYLPESLYFRHLVQTNEKYPGLWIMGTEACEGFLPWSRGVHLGSWSRAENYAYDMIGDINSFAAGWTDWNLFLNQEGGPNWAGNLVDAPILLDLSEGKKFYKQPTFYAMTHFSRWVTPGSIRIEVEIGGILSSTLRCAAFVTPEGKTVVLLLNKAAWAKSAYIKVPHRGYVDLDAIPARSLLTVIFKTSK